MAMPATDRRSRNSSGSLEPWLLAAVLAAVCGCGRTNLLASGSPAGDGSASQPDLASPEVQSNGDGSDSSARDHAQEVLRDAVLEVSRDAGMRADDGHASGDAGSDERQSDGGRLDGRSDGEQDAGSDASSALALDGGSDVGRTDGRSDGGQDAARVADVGVDSGSDDGGADASDGKVASLALVAGRLGGIGSQDGVGMAAGFNGPQGVVSDGAGHLFVADTDNYTIRQIAIDTGRVTTLAGSPAKAGSADGIGAAARFQLPVGLALDGAGNLFVADQGNYTIRQIVIATGAVTTLAGTAGLQGGNDGVGADASFRQPAGLAMDESGNLYVADFFGIRKIVVATGVVTTIAGADGHAGYLDGIGADARFDSPWGLAYDGAGNLFVADYFTSTIRQVVISTGAVATLAGSPTSGSADGVGITASFSNVSGLASDRAGHLFVGDTFNDSIRQIDVATASVSTLVGGTYGFADGTGSAAQLSNPFGLASDGAGTLFVADTNNQAIREVVVSTRAVSTLAGAPSFAGSADGTGEAATFSGPLSIAGDGAGHLFVADTGNHTIRQIAIATSAVTTLAGSAGLSGQVDGAGPKARLNSPHGITYDGAGDLFVADTENIAIRKIVAATGEVSTLTLKAGSGSSGYIYYPQRVVADGAGHLFVSDWDSVIYQITLTTGVVDRLAGASVPNNGSADGIGAAARFNYPEGLSTDGMGNLFVADRGNATIRQIVIATGEVTTVAGSPEVSGSSDGVGSSALFLEPTDVAADGMGNLFVADSGNHTVRKIDLASRAVTTVVGSPGSYGVVLGPLPGQLAFPTGLAWLSPSQLYLTDQQANAVLVAQF